MLEAELQARWQNGRTGRRGSARHISGWQNPLYTRQNLSERGFGLLALRRIFQHIKSLETSITLTENQIGRTVMGWYKLLQTLKLESSLQGLSHGMPLY